MITPINIRSRFPYLLPTDNSNNSMKKYCSPLNNFLPLIFPLGLLITVGVFSKPVSAASLVTIGHFFPGKNTCGTFLCDVGQQLNPVEEIAPLIIKADGNVTNINNNWTLENNDLSSLVDLENDFLIRGSTIEGNINKRGKNIVGNDEDSSNGNFTYQGDDLEIKYWAAKGGNQFTLLWQVETTQRNIGGACSDATNFYTSQCLRAAVALNPFQSVIWTTTPINELDISNSPNKSITKGNALSNFILYGGVSQKDDEPKEIPEPNLVTSCFLLFGLVSTWKIWAKRSLNAVQKG
ncbi:hypothetical protein IQ215_06680 [Cyanobacterium stanieri LEGE 03274]|uniref:PEP-CTERM sorting domain-containing protein n=1 Tax=Cyanobacterium stanieri LEGE 03274 TaxID=1828756 RepID=A0ABR9V3A2_9CHRO|nr:hypothetical protein [Cyanobacterium stanieri]MBE9222378.1 hypothetical protein [Cyanobacterium stanieri LEGE 03274]